MDLPKPARGRPTLLLVEDDISLLSAMSFALKADGFQVLAYADGRDLLTAPSQRGVDCLVVDLNLPGIGGLELIEVLRTRGETAPAILITTNPDERCRQQAAKAGVEIVEKPLLGGELRRRIDAAVGAN